MVVVPAFDPVVLSVIVIPVAAGDTSIIRFSVARVDVHDKITVGVLMRMRPKASSGRADPLVASNPPRTTMGTDMRHLPFNMCSFLFVQGP
jgi:hypothetical protein